MNKKLLSIVVGSGGVIIAFVIITSIISVQNTGLLKITAGTNTELTISKTAHQDKVLSEGDTTLRLEPGTYQITAKNGRASTTVTTEVQAGHQTESDVTTQAVKEPTTIAEYSGESVFADADGVRFLNPPYSQLFFAPSGQSNAFRSFEHVYPVTDVAWLDGGHVFTKNQYGVWQYSDSQTSRFLDTASAAFVSDSFSFAKNGQVGFMDEAKNTYILDNPNATARKVGSVALMNARTAINDNGEVLVFGRGDNSGPVIITAAGGKKELPASIENPLSAVWSPDNSKIAFALNVGFVIYDVASKSIQPLTLQQPTHPKSLAWLNNNEVIFAQDTALWRADTKKSQKVSGFTGILSNKPLFSYENNLYYATTPNNDSTGGAVYRITL